MRGIETLLRRKIIWLILGVEVSNICGQQAGNMVERSIRQVIPSQGKLGWLERVTDIHVSKVIQRDQIVEHNMWVVLNNVQET